MLTVVDGAGNVVAAYAAGPAAKPGARILEGGENELFQDFFEG
ncbi:hypothetical protein [Kitasatospora kifunensis]|uniref:Uncharacterized protein n=1 Tax=Kitasatospora kifunensis TaxID=58351 RepID=A0A7W7R6Z6_KITKI|nr:hypothetical protein [Kitasatospora kifunensis]MBB4926514.1 hypothetical protein [Kitasatospora kifunensis]